MRPPIRKTKGFTLVELSIVIVVIGLVIAGVTAGQSLVKTARMSAQITDLNKFESAYYAFKLQYNAVPGDMRNASSYWVGSTDGDGNGRITQIADYAYAPSYENMTFFTHLSRAKLVQETYNNVWQLGGGYPYLKLDSGKGMVAAGQMNVGGWGFQLSDSAATLRYTAAIYLDVSLPAAAVSGYNDVIGTASPITYVAIDRKMDDGVARTGKFRAYMAYVSTTNCLTGTDGDYLLTVGDTTCMAEFIIAK
jgi:prepilin-type N-terminal cleavage/methylation domain-containing protein